MATSDFKKAWIEANGDKESYLKAVSELNGNNFALIYWAQFNREIEVRQCVCANGGEVANFLRHLPLSHMDFTVVSTSSEDVESGYVLVVSNPVTKTITIHGSMFD